ncbi:MAG TPA: hypothetical protein VND19_06445, partial [Acetobacteraceae bacterium]|nr:hypothetical protein [Acetobacteraceae bacterium]
MTRLHVWGQIGFAGALRTRYFCAWGQRGVAVVSGGENPRVGGGGRRLTARPPGVTAGLEEGMTAISEAGVSWLAQAF